MEQSREVLTPGQVVAYNLARARKLRGWTQEQAADRLEPHLGVRWSNVVLSGAERSYVGKRVRQFTADEIVAFAKAFELPITWFFLPPGADADEEHALYPLISTAKGEFTEENSLTPSELLHLNFNMSLGHVIRETRERINSYTEDDSPDGDRVELATARGIPIDHVAFWVRSVMRDAMDREPWALSTMRNTVRRLAEQLDALVEGEGDNEGEQA